MRRRATTPCAVEQHELIKVPLQRIPVVFVWVPMKVSLKNCSKVRRSLNIVRKEKERNLDSNEPEPNIYRPARTHGDSV